MGNWKGDGDGEIDVELGKLKIEAGLEAFTSAALVSLDPAEGTKGFAAGEKGFAAGNKEADR